MGRYTRINDARPLDVFFRGHVPRKNTGKPGRLTDEEFASLVRDVVEVFQPRLANAPGTGRRRRLLYTVTLPDPRVTG